VLAGRRCPTGVSDKSGATSFCVLMSCVSWCSAYAQAKVPCVVSFQLHGPWCPGCAFPQRGPIRPPSRFSLVLCLETCVTTLAALIRCWLVTLTRLVVVPCRLCVVRSGSRRPPLLAVRHRDVPFPCQCFVPGLSASPDGARYNPLDTGCFAPQMQPVCTGCFA
jgi:hypothetical protein